MTVNDKADGKEPWVRPFGPQESIKERRIRMKESINAVAYPSYISQVRLGNGIVVQHKKE